MLSHPGLFDRDFANRRQNTMPPTINLERLADGFDCNYAPKDPQSRQIDVALTNSFGFGGTNSSLCFAKYS